MKNWIYQAPAESVFEGTIEVVVPGYTERLQLLNSSMYRINDEGKVLSNEEMPLVEKAMKNYEMVASRVKSVMMKVRATGEEVKSLDDLGCYQEGSEVINQLVAVIMGGLKLGKA